MREEKDFYQVSLKLLLKNSKGEVLVLKALDRATYAGYYDLPGGRINIGEFKIDFSVILAREVAEEIGDIKYKLHSKPVAIGRHLIPATISSLKKDTHVLYLFFEAQYLSGEITISKEHADYKWLDLTKSELNEYFISGILEGIEMYLGK